MTLGEDGALLVNATTQKHFPAISVPVVDTTGAGDSFNAGLAVALAHGESIEQRGRVCDRDAVRWPSPEKE